MNLWKYFEVQLRPQVVSVGNRMTEYFEFLRLVILYRVIVRFIEDEQFSFPSYSIHKSEHTKD